VKDVELDQELTINQCLNCNEKLPNEPLYCSNCGQKNTKSELRLREILANFISNTFYLDSKMWSSFGKIFIPASTTKAFVLGKRKKYLHPFRIFFVSAVFFFGLLNIYGGKILDKVDKGFNIHQDIETKLESYDRRTKLLDSLQDLSEIDIHRINFVAGLSPIFEKDTVLQDTIFPFGSVFNSGMEGNILEVKQKVNNRDLFNLDPDSLMDKYGVEGAWKRYNFKQSLRMSQNSIAGVKFLLNNFIWGVFLVIGVCALFLKFLYRKKSKTYVEALLLLFEMHSFAFIICAIGVSIEFLMGNTNFNTSLSLTFVLVFVYLLFLFHRYYEGKIIFTILKTVLFSLFYLVALVVFSTITSIISLAFF